MARLTNAELSHMKNRVKEIRDEAIRRLMDRNTKAAKEPSDLVKAKAVLDGDVEPLFRSYGMTKKKAPEFLDMKIREAFDFSELSPERELDECVEYKAAKAMVLSNYRIALDVIVLKEREAANKAFENFRDKYEVIS